MTPVASAGAPSCRNTPISKREGVPCKNNHTAKRWHDSEKLFADSPPLIFQGCLWWMLSWLQICWGWLPSGLYHMTLCLGCTVKNIFHLRCGASAATVSTSIASWSGWAPSRPSTSAPCAGRSGSSKSEFYNNNKKQYCSGVTCWHISELSECQQKLSKISTKCPDMINTKWYVKLTKETLKSRNISKTLRSQWAHGDKDTFVPTVCNWKWKWHDTNRGNTGVQYESNCGKTEASAGSEQHLLLVGAPSCWLIRALPHCRGSFLFREQYRTAGRQILYRNLVSW